MPMARSRYTRLPDSDSRRLTQPSLLGSALPKEMTSCRDPLPSAMIQATSVMPLDVGGKVAPGKFGTPLPKKDSVNIGTAGGVVVRVRVRVVVVRLVVVIDVVVNVVDVVVSVVWVVVVAVSVFVIVRVVCVVDVVVAVLVAVTVNVVVVCVLVWVVDVVVRLVVVSVVV
mmetsp:Transcript_17129/g.48918  ORF Transcript_17129/g.48918 Transcript_17129/m.48918 type:complete len:170 (-) Transcript_17129:127-636(-)